jgi:hypothetical protein
MCHYEHLHNSRSSEVHEGEGEADAEALVIHWFYSGVTVMLQWVYSGVTVVLQWCHSGVTVVLQWCNGDDDDDVPLRASPQ